MSKYNQFVQKAQRIADIYYASAVLQWDQEVYMPVKGAERRAQQLATLSGLAHSEMTNDNFGDLMKSLVDQNLEEDQHKNVKLMLEQFEKKKKLPTSFVELQSKSISKAFNAWQTARKENDFSLFSGELSALVDLKLQECEYIGYEEHPYNAMLDEYEKGMTVNKLEKIFGEVKNQLFPFIEKIYQANQIIDDCLKQHFNKDLQWEFSIDILNQIGYDFQAGRQDLSTHPFTTNFSSTDVRVTTRVNENNFSELLWSSIHEGGHALYEQGLPDNQYGLPLGTYLSLGMHESQSRLWENNVGRGKHFWKANFANLQNRFPNQLNEVSFEEFYQAMNRVAPSPIRTSADELTYHFHVLIRYEIEKALFEKTVKAEDLNALWNEQYKKYLGLSIQNDAEGILQDIHWSHGSFGYFPTYSIGSFYAAQFYAHAKQAIPELENEIASRKTSNLLSWLKSNIHQHGQKYTAEELCERVTGEGLNFDYFMNYAKEKYSDIYSL